MAHVGFTGTQKGMTRAQIEKLSRLLLSHHHGEIEGRDVFRHGDCIGADAEAHEIADAIGFRIIIHPPIDPKKRAFCAMRRAKAFSVEKPYPYLDRNSHIVSRSQLLLATPKEYKPRRGSGTWWTINRARELHIPVTIIYPNGELE